MKLIENENNSLEFHVSSSIFNNKVSNYTYKRVVIPKWIINYLKSYSKNKYFKNLYLYFINNKIIVSSDGSRNFRHLKNLSYVTRKLKKVNNSYYIELNSNDKILLKHNIIINSEATFIISNTKELDTKHLANIELIFE